MRRSLGLESDQRRGTSDVSSRFFYLASISGTAESTGCGKRAATANGKDPHERVYSRWPHRPVHFGGHALHRPHNRDSRHRGRARGNRVLHARRLRACRRGGGSSRAREDGRARRVVASLGGAPRCGGAVPSRGGRGGGAAYGVEGVAQPVRPPVGHGD